MQRNAEDNPVSTFLQLCYFYKRFGSSFWSEEKRKVRRPATIQQLQSWWKTHLPYDKKFYGARLHILTSHHAHCPGALSPNLSSQALLQNCWAWAFSTEPNESDLSLIVPSCNSHGVWAHTLASNLFQGPCDGPAGWLSPAQGGLFLLVQLCPQDLVGKRLLPSTVWLKEPRSTLLTCLHLQDLMGAIFYVETFWSLVILGVSGNKADTLLGNPF